MKILVTNDDGYESLALKKLIKELKQIAEVVVYAPFKCESAQSQKITVHKSIEVKKIVESGIDMNVVYGSTADCVRLGVFDHPDIDLVVSGVNLGLNLGQDIYYSSTVAAIIQAGMFKIRGVALSYDKNDEFLDNNLTEILKEVVLNNQKYEPLINVNLPFKQYNDFKGYKMTVQGNRYYENKFTINDGVYLETDVLIDDFTDGTDSFAVSEGYVSISNIMLKRTY